MGQLDREMLSRIAVATYLDPNTTRDLIYTAPMLTLPDYELSGCAFNCPRCKGTMVANIVNNAPYVGDHWVFRLNNLPTYRCATCSWEYQPFETFDFIEQTILQTMEKEENKNEL